MSAIKDVFDLIFALVAGPVLVLLMFGISYLAFTTMGIDPAPVISIMIALGPIWVPFLLFFLMYNKWMYYVRKKFALSQGRSTLRIKIPQEIFKSPEAMENVLAQVYNVQSIDNLMQAYIDGKHPLIMSLEIVSTGGDVKFYINCATKKVKNAVEAQLYAQYPGVEVIDEPIDYTGEVYWDPEKFEMMSFYVNKKEDEVFPIKTYIDFGMDKLPKEEQKFEPIAAMIEQMNTMKPGQHSWVQILCRPHTKKNFKSGYLSETKTWEGRIMAKINEIMGRNEKGKALGVVEEQSRLTPGERATIEAMERNMGKYAYEVEIRWIYAVKKGMFDGNAIAPMLRTFAQYDMIKRNQLGVRWRTDFDYNFLSDRSGKKKMSWKKAELSHYKKRVFFDSDLDRKIPGPSVFSVEELATLFHLPSSIVMTPGLSRLPSTRREAPPNLPVQIGE